ncbi:hypothetical protein RI844_04385 [Thalassotalea fonticola]|uniref:Uncharacterized protein n=1 Tax=Thalassotalea fonticola TaxID=3065649 RepID=A0ABZ0GSR7_9GAMM|nr:hypothetical protein RI844_04385 [Colwelliaceae bacterium S1-1]
MAKIQTNFEAKSDSFDKKTVNKNSKTKASLSNEGLNKLWCLGHSGLMLYDALKGEFDTIKEWSVITGLPYKMLKGMTWWDVQAFTMADI